jgi:hypothetical protein
MPKRLFLASGSFSPKNCHLAVFCEPPSGLSRFAHKIPKNRRKVRRISIIGILVVQSAANIHKRDRLLAVFARHIEGNAPRKKISKNRKKSIDILFYINYY